MAITSATELVAALQDWLVGHAISAETALSFIALAEAEMARALRIRQMIRRSTATISEGYAELPGDFLSPLNLTIGTDTPMRMVTADQADTMRGSLRGGEPRCWVLLGSQIEVLPNPTSEIDAELVYYARPAALQPGVTESNAVLVAAPDLYLQASLSHAASYIANPQRGAFWRSEADRITAQLTAEADAASYGASPLIVRPRRTYP